MNNLFQTYPGNNDQKLIEQLFYKTFNHPVLNNLIEWAPTDWLIELANPTPSTHTDLGVLPNYSPLMNVEAIINQEQLWQDLLDKGMRDPFILGVGRISRTIRLESGNHRIYLMKKNKVDFVPVVAYVGDSAITHSGNGSHLGKRYDLKIPTPQFDVLGAYPIKEYQKISDIINLKSIKL